ncbi:MBL fold metallo-hydrolase [Alicyclobacillus cycloheptanicus]|uniref:Ribonuclease BN (tRNA processing enzyme) n=1 Tax=Alicyclobacillus cycloheptanicus TaxID=1457 RepID=A0ABT9XIU0_9BACL|nr:MBL fold metallo-hydrolase [Alicyclobacillus cycloheptanicus]MDQ0190221.1 ribonuclease BN (tRNA processing enzyme) [Alicyclobacillus cycloheptanicus]
MRLHVLGYWGTYPGPGEATTGFLVETDTEKILLDCGSGVLAQLFHICDIPDLTGVVITHHHHDHVADLGVLSYSLLLARLRGTRTEELPFYMPPGEASLMRSLRGEPLIALREIDETSHVNVGDVTISFARTIHPVPCLAVRMEHNGKRFVFSADSAQSDTLTAFAADADLFLCEASMYAGQEEEAKRTGHLTAPQAGQTAAAAGARKLVLTHYPHYGDHNDLREQASAAFGGEVELVRTRAVLSV